jgi:16S rRNA (uracil1498-N3)-methyltransferase
LTSRQFFAARIDAAAGTAALEGEEHHHLARVARVRPGDEVWLMDGLGGRFLSRVERIGKERTDLLILRPAGTGSRRTAITLGQALLNAKKMEFVIQKAAELGAAAVIPVVTARSWREKEERAGRRGERWSRIAREAAKQSGRADVPDVPGAARQLTDFVRDCGAARRLFLSENGGRLLREVLADTAGAAKPPDSVVIMIGPEGGWTAAEEETLRGAGFEAVSLGEAVVRTETAALAATALVAHFWNT